MSGLIFKLALIGVAGISAQWAAWRLRIPAIAILLIVGFILGPMTGYVNPQVDLGDVYKPIVALSVAIILFEGGLTLNFREIRETSSAVRAIILLGGPMVWAFSALSAHYAAGLSWPSAIILGAILVVTGPTVIMPLLRQAKLGHRPASLLRWEAIVNDPIGALFAVVSFEVYLVVHGAHQADDLIFTLVAGFATAIIGGYLAGRGIARSFVSGHVPEYLKAPILLATVLFVYAVSDAVLKESGLLTVTVMGITLANSRIASLAEMRRFKETVTVLLVSGLFILLTASLDLNALYALGWGALTFVLLILFVVRPTAIMLATIGRGVSLRERILVSWIAPRGIVAVAVSGLFGGELVEMGVADGDQLIALTFAVVASTILLHGFSLGPLASLLNLKSADRPGVLIVGGSKWSYALAQTLKEAKAPVLLADSNWNHLRDARLGDIPNFFGEILSETAHHSVSFNRYAHLITATDNDAYNAMVCTTFGPEMGRGNVFQIGTGKDETERQALSFTLGGRPIFQPGRTYDTLNEQLADGWQFQTTQLTDAFGFSEYLDSRSSETRIICWIRENGEIRFRSVNKDAEPVKGDTIIAFGPPPASDQPKPAKVPDAS
ncbi:MAG: sodium:proton antiporter [Pseudomonadota bacterium]